MKNILGYTIIIGGWVLSIVVCIMVRNALTDVIQEEFIRALIGLAVATVMMTGFHHITEAIK